MNIEQYQKLGESVETFGESIGLNTRGIFHRQYEGSRDLWVMSVSQKADLDNTGVLFNYEDPFKRGFDPRLRFPIQQGTREEIEALRKKAEERDADIFIKKVIAYAGFVQPSPELLAKPDYIIAEIAFHEAFHATEKQFGERKVKDLPGWEEEHALLAGYLVSAAYFKGTSNEQLAIEQGNRHLDLARRIEGLTQELRGVLGFQVGNDKRPLAREQILANKDVVLKKARGVLGDSLGLPINNAFFIYWNYFYGSLQAVYERLSGITDIKEVVAKLKRIDFEDPFE